MRRLNVIEVVESCAAGVGKHVSSLCAFLHDQGHGVTLAYSPRRMDGAFRRFLDRYTGKIRCVPFDLRRAISVGPDLISAVQLARLIRREGPFDVIHGHSSKGGAIARVVGRLCGLPTVYGPQSLVLSSPEVSRGKALLYGAIERALGRLATSRIIAMSEDEGAFFVKLGLVPPERVAVIRNGIEAQEFAGCAGPAALGGLDQRPLTFGSTMRFSAQKAPHVLVDAFASVLRGLPGLPVRLVMAGQGELLEATRTKVAERGLAGAISLPGWRDDPGAVLRDIDIFVVSSHYEAGLSFSTMEAMAAGLPVVSTRVFGVEDTLGRIAGNILVPPGDPVALAQAMRAMATLCEPESLRARLHAIGQANRDHVRRHHRLVDALRSIEDLYRELAGT